MDTINQLKIPSNGLIGEWRINVSSGANLDIIEFEVISNDTKKIGITVTEDIDIPGFGKNIKVSIATNQKTSITMNVVDVNGNQIGDSSTCTPTTDFKCEILWTIPKDTIPGTYIVRVNDSIIIEETTFEIK